MVAGLAMAATLALSPNSPARAQQLVYDPSAVGKLIQQAQTGLNQLEQLKAQLAQTKQLYDGFNQASGVNGLATILSSPTVRSVLPDAQAYIAAAKGDLSALGQIGARAARIRDQSRLYTPPADDPAGQAVSADGDRAARDLALGETVADAGALRLQGLQQLQTAIGAAPNARAVLDLQARLAAEQAMIANDQMRLQGLAMAQAAEDHLARQHELERIAAACTPPQPRSPSYFAVHLDEANRVLAACRDGRTRGQECVNAEAGPIAARNAAREALYRSGFAK